MASEPGPGRRPRPRPARRAVADAAPCLSPDLFREGFGEDLTRLLDLGTWRVGRDLDEEYRQIDEQVREAIALETSIEATIRERVHALLCEGPGAPPGAGRYAVTTAEMA